MAFIWVQVWGPLSTTNGFIMGDVPLGSQSLGRDSNMASRPESTLPSSSDQFDESEERKQRQGSNPQSQAYTQQQQLPQTRMDSFNMNSIGATLPDLSYQNYGQLQPQRYALGHSSSTGLIYQLPNPPQFSTAQTLAPSSNSPYNIPYQGQYQGMYAPGHTPSPPHLQSSTSQFYQNQAFMPQQQQQGSAYFIQSSQYSPQGHMYPPVPSPTQYGPRSGFSGGDPRLQAQQRTNEYLKASYPSGTVRPTSISMYSFSIFHKHLGSKALTKKYSVWKYSIISCSRTSPETPPKW